jgi:hypothetical protein
MLQSWVSLLACPAVLPWKMTTLLGKPAVSPDFLVNNAGARVTISTVG